MKITRGYQSVRPDNKQRPLASSMRDVQDVRLTGAWPAEASGSAWTKDPHSG